jgi:hypothetical protein
MSPWTYQTLARFRALFFRSKLDRQLEEELATHLVLMAEGHVARGMDPHRDRR